jgi:hypothetical protein
MSGELLVFRGAVPRVEVLSGGELDQHGSPIGPFTFEDHRLGIDGENPTRVPLQERIGTTQVAVVPGLIMDVDLCDEERDHTVNVRTDSRAEKGRTPQVAVRDLGSASRSAAVEHKR